MSENPWNYCNDCDQPLDVGDEPKAGKKVECDGCGQKYAIELKGKELAVRLVDDDSDDEDEDDEDDDGSEETE